MLPLTLFHLPPPAVPPPVVSPPASNLDPILCKCWDAICNNRCEEENGFLLLHNPDGTAAAWGAHYSYADKVFVRAEYDRTYNELMKNTKGKISLCGTKGIGKTIFMYWLIFKLVALRPTGSPIPSFLLIIGDPPTYYVLQFCNGNAEIVDWNRQKIDYLLSDVNFNLNITPSRWSLLVSSYGSTKTRNFLDSVGNCSGLQIVMGAVKKQEIMKLAPSEQIGEFSYLIFGGSIRMLRLMSATFAGVKVITETHYSDLKSIMLEFLADSKYGDGSYDALIEKSCQVICNQMDVNNSTVDAIKHSLFWHSYAELDENQNIKIVPTVASTFLGYYASFLREKETENALSGLRQMFSGSGIGNLFERHVLKTVIEKYKSGGQFIIKRMYPTGYQRTVNDEDEFAWNIRFKRKVFIQTIEDIKSLKDGELGIPSISNFPVVDFVIKPFIEGQITVGRNHSCAYGRHQDIEVAMGEATVAARKHIFFCDNLNFNSFQYDKKLLPDVKQYKMLVAWTAKRKRPNEEEEVV